MRKLILTALMAMMPVVAMAQQPPAIAPTAPADPNILTIKDATPQETILLLGGAAMGIGYTNAQLVVEHKEELFCSPPGFNLGAQTLYDAAAVLLKGPQDPGKVIIAGLDTLKRKFPCTKK